MRNIIFLFQNNLESKTKREQRACTYMVWEFITKMPACIKIFIVVQEKRIPLNFWKKWNSWAEKFSNSFLTKILWKITDSWRRKMRTEWKPLKYYTGWSLDHPGLEGFHLEVYSPQYRFHLPQVNRYFKSSIINVLYELPQKLLTT